MKLEVAFIEKRGMLRESSVGRGSVQAIGLGSGARVRPEDGHVLVHLEDGHVLVRRFGNPEQPLTIPPMRAPRYSGDRVVLS